MPELFPKLPEHRASQAIHNQVPQPAAVTASILETFSAKVDSSDRIKHFISTQVRYAKAHAAEGRAELASWKPDGTPRTPPRAEPLVSAFDTPVLKPRVPGTELDVNVGSKQKKGDSELPALQATGKADQVRVSKDWKENAGEKKRDESKGKGKEVEATQEDRRGDTKRSAARKPMVISVAASKKRPKTPTSSEVDHTARLADRRERKRARREIVKPAPIASSSVDKENDVADDDIDDDASMALKLRKPTKGGKAKPSKTKKIPAGFALMHGFSAQNIGGNRLTVKPSINSQYGVFNRGRASTKAKVNTKPISARGALFSEDRFLNSTRSHPADPSLGAGRFHRLADEDASSSHASSAASIPAVTIRTKPITVKGNKRRRETSSHSPSDGAPVPREESIAAESAPWDIEDCHSLSSKSASEPSRKQSTAVMDIRQHRIGKLLDKSAPRAQNKADRRDDTDGETRHAQTPARDLSSQDEIPSHQLTHGTMSSLAPSESASQMLGRAQKVVKGMQLSKYFAQPRKLPPAEEARPTSTPLPVKSIPASQPLPLTHPPQAAPILPSPGSRSHSLSQPLPAVTRDLPVPSSPDVKRPSSPDSLERALKALDVPDPSLRFQSRRSRPSRRRPATAPDDEVVYNGYELDRGAEAQELCPDDMVEVDAVDSECGTLFAVDEQGQVFAVDGYTEDMYGAELAHEEAFGYEDRSQLAYDAQNEEEGAMINPDEYPYAEYCTDAEEWVTGADAMEDRYALDEYEGHAVDEGDVDAQYDYDQSDFAEEWRAEEVRAASQTPGPAGLFLRTSYHAEEDVARQLQGHWRPQTY